MPTGFYKSIPTFEPWLLDCLDYYYHIIICYNVLVLVFLFLFYFYFKFSLTSLGVKLGQCWMLLKVPPFSWFWFCCCFLYRMQDSLICTGIASHWSRTMIYCANYWHRKTTDSNLDLGGGKNLNTRLRPIKVYMSLVG